MKAAQKKKTANQRSFWSQTRSYFPKFRFWRFRIMTIDKHFITVKHYSSCWKSISIINYAHKIIDPLCALVQGVFDHAFDIMTDNIAGHELITRGPSNFLFSRFAVCDWELKYQQRGIHVYTYIYTWRHTFRLKPNIYKLFSRMPQIEAT